MKSLFTKSFYKNNRRKLVESVPGESLFVIGANGLIQKSADTTFVFRQDSNFKYLTGLNEPDLVLVIDGQEEYLIVPARSGTQEVFDGKIDNAKLSQISGVDNILDDSEGWARLEKSFKKQKSVGILKSAGDYIERYGFYTNPAKAALEAKITKISGGKANLTDVRPVLARLRMIKQPSEIKALQLAIDATIDNFNHVFSNRQNYQYEYQIEADMTQAFMAKNLNHAYDPIIASGRNACTLHYISNNDIIKPQELILIDAAAEVESYAADITRTFSVGKPTARQNEVLQAVMEVQDYAFSVLKPGILLKDYEKLVESFMGERLKSLGLINQPSRSEIRKYYPHATSHFLGLDVHDAADYDIPLSPNMVLTVEPGIYIPEENIGVRIEDDVIVASSGIKVLSERLPTRLG